MFLFLFYSKLWPDNNHMTLESMRVIEFWINGQKLVETFSEALATLFTPFTTLLNIASSKGEKISGKQPSVFKIYCL